MIHLETINGITKKDKKKPLKFINSDSYTINRQSFVLDVDNNGLFLECRLGGSFLNFYYNS